MDSTLLLFEIIVGPKADRASTRLAAVFLGAPNVEILWRDWYLQLVFGLVQG